MKPHKFTEQPASFGDITEVKFGMKEHSFIFASAQDALKVGEQLPNAQIVDNHVFCADGRALKLAVALAAVTNYVQEGAYCRLPYPRREREYNGDSPSICVSCLSAYNSALLHWLWIDATQDADEILDDIQWMLSWSPVAREEACEEWAIHDFEGFGSFQLSEYEDLETVSKIANAVEEYGSAFAEYVACEFPSQDIKDWDEVVEKFETAFVGHFESERDFVLSSGEIDEMYNFEGLQKQFPFWANHVDWDGVAFDLFCSHYYSTGASGQQYGIYVFRSF